MFGWVKTIGVSSFLWWILRVRLLTRMGLDINKPDIMIVCSYHFTMTRKQPRQQIKRKVWPLISWPSILETTLVWHDQKDFSPRALIRNDNIFQLKLFPNALCSQALHGCGRMPREWARQCFLKYWTSYVLWCFKTLWDISMLNPTDISLAGFEAMSPRPADPADFFSSTNFDLWYFCSPLTKINV